MHARIDRQKWAIPTKYGNRYQLENPIWRTHRQNVLETAPIDAPWSLYWNGCLSELGSDLYGTGSGPLGGLRPSWDTECAPKDSTVGICCYMARNDRLVKRWNGSEGFVRICPGTSACNAKCLSGMTAPWIAGWIDLQDSTIRIWWLVAKKMHPGKSSTGSEGICKIISGLVQLHQTLSNPCGLTVWAAQTLKIGYSWIT